MIEIGAILGELVKHQGSDAHLKVGSPPCVRVHGDLTLLGTEKLSADDTERLALSMMNGRQKERFEARQEVDFAYSLSGVGRFRVNIYRQRGSVSLNLRRVAIERPTTAELHLPEVVEKLADEQRGLVLVTGTAGSGKTTTLAAMIDHINRTRRCHIVTVEDPIEVLHSDIKSIISQREIGIDTESFADALKHVVRQDPDVILIGEMRDKETVESALSAAEMGNLVLSTIHTIDAPETINRIIDFFPPHQQKQVRVVLASTLVGIVSLRLLPRKSGGRIPAVEVMLNTATIKEFITNEGETSKIKDAIEQGDYYGMQSFDQSLIKLISEGEIDQDQAMAMAANAHDFKLKVRQLGMTPAGASALGGSQPEGPQGGQGSPPEGTDHPPHEPVAPSPGAGRPTPTAAQ